MNPETKAILDALRESRQILEAKLQAMDTKLDAVAADVTAVKEQLADMGARDRYLTQKTGELEAELFVVKRRQKA